MRRKPVFHFKTNHVPQQCGLELCVLLRNSVPCSESLGKEFQRAWVAGCWEPGQCGRKSGDVEGRHSSATVHHPLCLCLGASSFLKWAWSFPAFQRYHRDWPLDVGEILKGWHDGNHMSATTHRGAPALFNHQKHLQSSQTFQKLLLAETSSFKIITFFK